MDEHLHAETYHTLLERISSLLKEHGGLTSEELTGLFEHEGVLSLAMRLPEVRQALTIVLIQGLYHDTETGELFLDLDEERLIH